MNDSQMGPGSLLDTTDSLEAVGVFRGWKNFFFIIVLLCLLTVQGSFWLVNTGSVGPVELCSKCAPGDKVAPIAAADPNKVGAAVDPNAPTVTDPNVVAETKSGLLSWLPFDITYRQLRRVIYVANAVLFLTAGLYCLTILFSLKVSLTGRLGGISHISRAFFLSLNMFGLLLPWQTICRGAVIGAMYTPCELAGAYLNRSGELFGTVLYYLRFSGYWLLVFLLFMLTQLRTCRWTRAILRRLEVV